MWLADISPLSLSRPLKQVAGNGQAMPFVGKAGKSLKQKLCPGDLSRWGCRAEYQRAHRIDQIFPNRPAAQQIGSH